MADISQMSDEELMKIAGIPQESPSGDLSHLYDEELMAAANKPAKDEKLDTLLKLGGKGRWALDDVRDALYGGLVGAGKGAQGAAQLLGNSSGTPLPPNTGFGAGQNPASLSQISNAQPRKQVPTMDMEQYFSGIASPKQSMGGEQIKALMQYLPAMLSGGESLAGQTAASTAQTGLMADPNQSNALDYLPKGRTGAMMENVLLGMLGPMAKGGKAIYGAISPKKAANELLSSISTPVERPMQGHWSEAGFIPPKTDLPTASQNIEELGKRAQFGKGSALEESLIPKRELYNEEGKSNIYEVDPSKLPEGNIGRMSAMFAEGGKFKPYQADALSSALNKYRKTGDVQDFIEKGQDIFDVPELPEKHEKIIEDALLMPTERKSHYFGDEDVTLFYGKKGNLKNLHDDYKNKQTLNNYDKLQSALKKEKRELDRRAKNGFIGDTAEAKRQQLESNIENLDKDQLNFSKELPEKMRNLDLDWRTKYAKNVAGFTNNDTLDMLSKGEWEQVKPNEIQNAFTYADPATKKALSDMGPSAKNNILYNAILSSAEGDPEKVGNAVLNLRKTKGYEDFVTPEMEEKANKLISKSRNVINPENWPRMVKKLIGK